MNQACEVWCLLGKVPAPPTLPKDPLRNRLRSADSFSFGTAGGDGGDMARQGGGEKNFEDHTLGEPL